ncbi:MAG: hypothetical protein E6J85_21300 [Deltaproteobacteria bacterium]|nr:MAG: hypothetical protein E6J85_21300 [Deltaproteobacteria bacterium]
MPVTLAELLVKIQLIDDRQHDAVLSRARSRSGPHVIQQIVEMGIATESTMARSIAAELSVPRIDLGATPPEPDVLHLLDARICVDRYILPVSLRENGEALLLVMADPTDQETMALVQDRPRSSASSGRVTHRCRTIPSTRSPPSRSATSRARCSRWSTSWTSPPRRSPASRRSSAWVYRRTCPRSTCPSRRWARRSPARR